MADPFAPLWRDTAPPLAAHARIFTAPAASRGASTAQARAALPSGTLDAAVIGAGVTGLSTALHLAEAGARVAVLECTEPGGGASGRANGQIIAGLQPAPATLLAALGAERGERLVRFAGDAPRHLFDLVGKHRIDCDAEATGWVQATRSRRRMKHLEELAQAWRARGAPVRVLGREELARAFGTDDFAGGWLDERDGTIQPLSYVRGLARAAADAGASVHGGVRVQAIERSVGRGWRVRTDGGEVFAPNVVLAANVGTRGVEGIGRACVGRSYFSAYSVQIATEPLTDAAFASVLPSRIAGSTVEHVRLRYFRFDRDRRLVFGGPGWLGAPRSPRAISFRVLEAAMRRMFPALAKARVTHRWFARDTVTPDVIPHLYEPAPGLYSALGFNGRGLAIGTALGSVLARRVLGAAADELPYPLTDASRLPLNLPDAARFYLRLARHRWLHPGH